MKSENLARIFVFLFVTGLLGAVLLARFLQTRQVVELRGEMAESGGWTPDVLHAEAGQPLHLRLTSADVTHGFAIGQSDQAPVDIDPGQVSELTLTFDRPGIYTFYCTRWCGLNHWRMRGTIEVSGETASQEPAPGQPVYVQLGLDIDSPHPAAVLPSERPSAAESPLIELDEQYLEADFYRGNSPDEVFSTLRADAALAGLDDTQLWDLTAAIWKRNTSPEALLEAGKLYAANCAACHGETGQGDGVFAEESATRYAAEMAGMAGGRPVDFSAAETMLGASPALLQGKILRGGMGSGMPMWGSIFTEQQTWDLAAYLYTFSMDTR